MEVSLWLSNSIDPFIFNQSLRFLNFCVLLFFVFSLRVLRLTMIPWAPSRLVGVSIEFLAFSLAIIAFCPHLLHALSLGFS